ncbi:MAG: NAD(P) transhydrogenase subunit alpha [Dehalococcoidales bacterium]|nr:NAD(P) transhydrogenase subunit alpha [Dehalococcoidales bacterium]
MDQSLIILLYVFVLAMFAGYEVITKVPPLLQTPLMSGSNAISGVCVVGAMIIAGPRETGIPVILGMIAIVLGTINVVGGFMVTDRMMAMFKKQK